MSFRPATASLALLPATSSLALLPATSSLALLPATSSLALLPATEDTENTENTEVLSFPMGTGQVSPDSVSSVVGPSWASAEGLA